MLLYTACTNKIQNRSMSRYYKSGSMEWDCSLSAGRLWYKSLKTLDSMNLPKNLSFTDKVITCVLDNTNYYCCVCIIIITEYSILHCFTCIC